MGKREGGEPFGELRMNFFSFFGFNVFFMLLINAVKTKQNNLSEQLLGWWKWSRRRGGPSSG